jgi:hypothetical protein
VRQTGHTGALPRDVFELLGDLIGLAEESCANLMQEAAAPRCLKGHETHSLHAGMRGGNDRRKRCRSVLD